MKKVAILITMALLMAACEKQEEPTKAGTTIDDFVGVWARTSQPGEKNIIIEITSATTPDKMKWRETINGKNYDAQTMYLVYELSLDLGFSVKLQPDPLTPYTRTGRMTLKSKTEALLYFKNQGDPSGSQEHSYTFKKQQ